MAEKLKIVISNKATELTNQIEVLLSNHPNYDVSTLINNHSSRSSLLKEADKTDLVILTVSDAWREDLSIWRDELAKYAETLGDRVPSILIVGSVDQHDVMRMAMRMGASDFLSGPVEEQELLEAIKIIDSDRISLGRKKAPKITVVMNAKGGSGATMLACNIATIMSQHLGEKTALVDLDVQFGTLPLYFDMMPKHSILEALDIIGSLDPTGLEGYMMPHTSGLKILGSKPDKVVLPDEVSATKLNLLLDMLQQDNKQIIVDLPRQIDHITTTILERADRIIIVTQQTLTHCRDAVRLLGILKDELLISDERILLSVNRYDKSSVVTIDDINKTLKTNAAMLIPNDYKNAMQSENIGIPLYEYARKSPITTTLIAFTERLIGKETTHKKNFLSRVITNITREH